VTVYGILARR